MSLLIELRALELFNHHYASRPHIKVKDYSMIQFYREVAASEPLDHEVLRRECGGSFE